MSSNVELGVTLSIIENPTEQIDINLNHFPEFLFWSEQYLKFEKDYEGNTRNYCLVDDQVVSNLYFDCRHSLESDEHAKSRFGIEQITPQSCFNLTMLMRFCDKVGSKLSKRRESSTKVCFKVSYGTDVNPRE